ncbi:MAG: hypothetical protein A2W91_03120 [Bacteroidetes bacterium GWF2_38_335]|nr:MAG: hypothetical protein A2W91_03120 [Bacteroidetes bacterium GWF2_38_335]OFY77519.1 MAG: hypothetical protein A2281_01640 [Bacteroidetes bacterium RIFOXYA12_FULL_38_20]HBS87185.1 hypothetical protein [Bacteroidales bacterium]
MKISIKDKVRFLNDTGGGIVVRVIDKDNVMILTEDDFEVPAAVKNLIVIETTEKVAEEPYVSDLSYNYAVNEEEEYYDEDFDENDTNIRLLLAFEPEGGDVLNNKLNMYLINDSHYWLLYNIVTTSEDTQAGILSGKLEPDTKLYITAYEKEELNLIKSFTVQGIFYRNGRYKMQNPVNETVVLKHSRFYKDSSFTENDYFETAALIIEIEDPCKQKIIESVSQADITKILKEKDFSENFHKQEAQKFKAKPEVPLLEVDLHINELVDNSNGMSNAEMLEIQISHFRSELEKAISDKVNRIVFIHGIGAGTLKMEIRKILEKEYKFLNYQDASYQKYGFGATMVILRK